MQHVLFGLVFLYAVLPPGNSGRQDTVHGQNSALVDSKYPIEKCAVVFHQDFVPQLNIRKLRFGAETKPGLQEQWGKIMKNHMDLFLSTSGPGHLPKNCPRHRCRRLRPGGPGQQMGSVNFEKNQGFWLHRPTSPMVARAEAVTFFWASPACGKIHALRVAI